MKPIFLLLLASCLAAFGQPGADGVIPHRDHDPEERSLREAQKEFVPQDPWRTLNGSVQFAKGPGWLQFYGTVIGQSFGKTYIHGWCGTPLEYEKPYRVFCVTNLPATIVGESLLPNQNLTAFRTPFDTPYYSAAYGAQPCMMLDYGAVWMPPPPTPEQVAAARAAAAAAKAQADARKQKAGEAALKYDLDLAAKGDAFGQLRMGERYRDGEGVAKDPAKAREMFSLAAAQGNADAASDLAKLPPP